MSAWSDISGPILQLHDNTRDTRPPGRRVFKDEWASSGPYAARGGGVGGWRLKVLRAMLLSLASVRNACQGRHSAGWQTYVMQRSGGRSSARSICLPLFHQAAELAWHGPLDALREDDPDRRHRSEWGSRLPDGFQHVLEPFDLCELLKLDTERLLDLTPTGFTTDPRAPRLASRLK